MLSSNYHYVIVGGGMAGLQLALSFSKDLFFKGKKIAIIDPEHKTRRDKTWCFWEKGSGKWKEIVHKEWEKGIFASRAFKKELEISPYKYKMVRSRDFYSYTKASLEQTGDFDFIEDSIISIDPVRMKAFGETGEYTASHFFDSRISSEFYKDTKHSNLKQHFKGWLIETENPSFDPGIFTMMDFRLKYNNSTSFTYCLPVSPTKALIEFTFFTPFLTEDSVYDEYLEKYISDILKIKEYEILETEKGEIPMTDFPFHLENTPKITKIGTGGSWVKGSTGYSFKNTEKKVDQLIENIKAGRIPSQNLVNERFQKYDAIFLDVLSENNQLGEGIFSKLYSKNSPQEIFKYLDEETKISEELKIMFSLFHPQFILSFFRKVL